MFCFTLPRLFLLLLSDSRRTESSRCVIVFFVRRKLGRTCQKLLPCCVQRNGAKLGLLHCICEECKNRSSGAYLKYTLLQEPAHTEMLISELKVKAARSELRLRSEIMIAISAQIHVQMNKHMRTSTAPENGTLRLQTLRASWDDNKFALTMCMKRHLKTIFGILPENGNAW